MFVQVMRIVAFVPGFTGVAAGFWHITPIAGVGALVAAMFPIGVQSINYVWVDLDDARTAPSVEDREPPA